MRPSLTALLLTLLAAPLHADTFGSGPESFTIPFADVNNPGNAADTNGRGAVGHTYRIGVHEVSRGSIERYNASQVLVGGALITLNDMTSSGGNSPGRPATGVSWNEAARFVNWLNALRGLGPADKFTGAGANDDVAQWDVGEPGYDPANPFRNANAYYFLPDLNEWHKAAYYDPVAGAYWDYATGSNSAPVAVAGGTAPGTAVIAQSSGAGPADVTNAGGLSPYGTMGQNGNVTEWTESYINSSGDFRRAYTGGAWTITASTLASQTVLYTAATAEFFSRGFRVAAVPEPSAVLLAWLGLAAGLLRRQR
jgi:formylglycine-generating enzyme